MDSRVPIERRKMNEILKHSLHIALAAILLLIVFAGSLIVGNFIQTNAVSLSIDAYFYNLIANGPHFALIDILVWPINNNFLKVGVSTMPSYFVVLLSLFLLYLAIFKRNAFLWAALTLFIATFIIGLIYNFNAQYIFRERPYITLPNHLDEGFKNALKGWNSYPSGHARDTAIYSVIIASFIPVLTIPCIILTLFVGYSRIYVGAHYPTDIIVGLIMGVMIAKASLIITKELKTIFERLYGKKRNKEK